MKDPLNNSYARELKRIMDERNQLTRFIESDSLRHIKTAMDTTAHWARDIQIMKSAMLEAHNYGISSVLDMQMHGDVSRLSRQLEDQFRYQSLTTRAFEALCRPAIENQLASVLHQQDNLTQIVNSMQSRYKDMIAPSRHIESALASIEASARLYSRADNYWKNSLSLVGAYEQFAVRQAKHLAGDTVLVAERRARVTKLAGTLLVPTIGASQAAAMEFEDTSLSQIDLVKPRLFGPLNSHLGYIYCRDFDGDVDLEVASALPSRISHYGGEIVTVAVRINEKRRRHGDQDIFKPTNRSLKAASSIPSVVADSESLFGEIVDDLYFLLYEGAGGSKLRLKDLANDEELCPLWHLKQLRLYFRHDIEHGSESEIKIKHQKIADAFSAITDGDIPSRPSEWIAAQSALYQQLHSMLITVQENIKQD